MLNGSICLDREEGPEEIRTEADERCARQRLWCPRPARIWAPERGETLSEPHASQLHPPTSALPVLRLSSVWGRGVAIGRFDVPVSVISASGVYRGVSGVLCCLCFCGGAVCLRSTVGL